MRKALEYLLPYATGEKRWPYQQIWEMRRVDLAGPLLEAAKAFQNPKYEAAARRLSAGTGNITLVLLENAPKTGTKSR